MKRIFLLLVAAALVLVGVLGISQERGGVAVIGYGGNYVADPDPHKASNMGEHSMALLMAEPLVSFDEAGAFLPVLARSWEVSPDGKVYTFHLREGVLFHSGRPLTAQAVKQNIDRIRNPENALPAAGHVANVEEVVPVDDLTVEVRLSKPDPDFPGKLEFVYITDPEAWADRGPDDPVPGTGPFRLVGEEYERDRQMVFEKFSDYWGGEPYLDRIVVRLVPSPETAVVELERGSVDFLLLGVFSATEARRLEAEGYPLYVWGFVNAVDVVFNLATLDDLALRRAICYAIDHQVLIDAVLGGFGELQRNLGFPGTWLEETEVVAPCCDPEKAKEILDAAGYVDTDGDGIREKDGKDIVLRFRAPDSGDWLRGSQLIQQMLLEVGIGSELLLSERHMFYDQVRTGDYDIAWWFQNSFPTPPILLYSWDSRDYWSIHQVELPELQALIEAAEAEIDQGKRAELYRNLQRIFDENAYAALGIWVKQIYVGSPSLHGVKVTPEGQLFGAHEWWKG